METRKNLRWGMSGVAVLSFIIFLGAVGCGSPGVSGDKPGAASTVVSGTVSGNVTNSLTGNGLGGVTVAIDPPVKDVNVVTAGSGTYSVQLPVGIYTVTFKKVNFDPATQTVSVIAGQTTARDVALKPSKRVVVDAGADQESAPKGSVTLKVSAEALDGSTISGYQWSQTTGVKAGLSSATGDTTTVTLGADSEYKEALLKGLSLLERYTVLGINPHALSEAATVAVKVTVTTASGTYSDTVNLNTKLPYAVNPGIANVPVSVPVLLNSKTARSYDWTLSGPSGSKAALSDAQSRNPSFTPDLVGQYTLTEKRSHATIDVFAGTWAGAITGLDAKGRPQTAGCTVCHDGKTAPDKFTAWKNSGHSEIFTQNINDPNGHWSLACAQCHTVGYNQDAKNGGFDEAMSAEGWKVPSHGEAGYYAKMLTQFPKTAKMANIQCENCHGPNDGSGLHANKKLDDARISLSADVCGSCHGELPRHARFQQWEESAHARRDLTVNGTVESRGATAGHCGRCHSAQGFLAWIEQGNLTLQIQGAKGNATVDELSALGMTTDKVEPQTCATCHDPHAQGTTTGVPTEETRPTSATVRVMDVTALLPAGFQAKDVGKGALCITCHNTRNDVHNIDKPPTSYSAPHVASQGDVLMGENAYFVNTPQRSPHSLVRDTCVTCHMEETPPPADLSYQQSGTNHTFEASTSVCKSCHSAALNAKGMQSSVKQKVETLGQTMGAYLLSKLPASVTIMDYTAHDYAGKTYDLLSDALVVNKADIASAEPVEPHGQQGFTIKFKAPKTFTYTPAGESSHTIGLTEAEVRIGDISSDGRAVIPFTDKLLQAGWNYFLIHGDSSGGIHNPAFVNDVLDTAIRALK